MLEPKLGDRIMLSPRGLKAVDVLFGDFCEKLIALGSRGFRQYGDKLRLVDIKLPQHSAAPALARKMMPVRQDV